MNNPNRLLGIPYLLKVRAQEYRKLCRHNEALTYFHKALEYLNILLDAHPNDKDLLRFQGEVMIDISTELLKHDEALVDPNRLLEINLNYEKILSIRAKTYTAIGKYDEALIALNRLLEINPNNEEILSIRAQAYTAIGKNDKALVDLTRLLEINPDNKKALECFILMILMNDEETSYLKLKDYFDGKL